MNHHKVRVRHNRDRNLASRGIRVLGFFTAAAVTAFMVLAGVGGHVQAATGQTMWMGTSVGFGGYYKREDWVPVTMSIHHVGPETSAMLTVHINQNLEAGRRLTGSLQWPIRMPKDGWMTTQIVVPGGVLDSGATVVCTANGKTMFTAPLTGNAVANVALVVVLATSNQQTQFLAGSSTGSNPVLPVSVNPMWFPTSVNALDGLTAVVVPFSTLQSLTSAQQSALETWVKLGGLMIVPGTGTAPAAWRSILPLTSGSTREVNAKSLLDFANTSDQLSSPTLTVDVGGISSTSRLWAGTNQAPMLASEYLGRGQIWQTAFSPMDPELLGWSGNSLLWTSLLKQGTQEATAIPHFFDENGALSLASVGDALAPLRVPSLPVFAVVFAVYIVVIGPVVFFILRRFRRAQYAWTILPVLSIVTTIAIYGFGGAQRPKGMLADGVGVLDLTGEGTAESYGVEAFMSPYVGGLDFELPSASLAVPMAVRENLSAEDAVVSYGSSTMVTFRDVGRWHVRYLYASGMDNQAGSLQTDFVSAYGLLFGDVENQTPYVLDHVALLWENHMYEIGTLKPGQTVTLDPTAQNDTTQWISDYGTYNRALTHGLGRSLGAYLSSGTVTSTTDKTDVSTPPRAMIVATTETRTPELPKPIHEQDVTSDKTLVLVRQYANVEPGTGDFLP